MALKPDPLLPLDALADPTRREILRVLRKGPLAAGEIADAFDLARPTLSHHFRILAEAGLVQSERLGTRIIYSLRTATLEKVANELISVARGPARGRA
jgi:DNA-binding transcriptional ArsR family regulator